jgi:hypothetical protein
MEELKIVLELKTESIEKAIDIGVVFFKDSYYHVDKSELMSIVFNRAIYGINTSPHVVTLRSCSKSYIEKHLPEKGDKQTK